MQGRHTREKRVSSTPRLLGCYRWRLEYWIARRSLSSGGHSADPLAGDDSQKPTKSRRDDLAPAFCLRRLRPISSAWR
jgi:hypothetical protein